MRCTLIVIKREGFSQITDLANYLNSNLRIVHCSVVEPWVYDRFLQKLDNDELKAIMADFAR